MIYLEMSRSADHGGPGWGFGHCLWSPSRTTSGSRWPFWSKVLSVVPGDTVVHLFGKGVNAKFVGTSVVASHGDETELRPPIPGQWAFARTFYRADLDGYVPLKDSIPLADIFLDKKVALTDYFERNKSRGFGAKNIFFTRQSNRLQCLNGAYLSELEPELVTTLFEVTTSNVSARSNKKMSFNTRDILRDIRVRVGHTAFANEVKSRFGHRCCVPGCLVNDERFLIASHIARWSDNESLRGDLGNGLSLCVLHDKAFEVGLFSLTDDFRILINPSIDEGRKGFLGPLLSARGEKILLHDVLPLKAAVAEHRKRVKADVWTLK